MEIFKHLNNINKPLAERMKPKSFETFFGQSHILKKGSLLRNLIENQSLSSIILYGPTGVGKTSLANIISNETNYRFEKINAVISGVKEIKEMIEIAKTNENTILFIDEIHRFNKIQQDALLPFVEDGTITLIGATTMNPYFSLNNALLSRSNIFELKKLKTKDINKILINALNNDVILKEKDILIDKETIEYIATKSKGDSRVALNTLEIATLLNLKVNIEIIDEALKNRFNYYDKDEDNHYDTISAFIKSVRGSDIDASLYYLAKMLNGGEDILFIARRLIILASEDIGLADNNALILANSVFEAVKKIGMPEARIPLSQLTIYLAKAKKSNSSYLAINKALDYVKNEKSHKIPKHLEDTTKKAIKNEDNKYKYPHDYNDSKVLQRYLPKGVNEKFYIEKDNDC